MEELNGIPVYYFTIDEEITDEGVSRISIVNGPAVEKTFIKMSLHCQNSKSVLLSHQDIKLSIDDEKRIITGVALRPDFPIYRKDNDKEYYLMLSKDEVLKISQKFMMEQRTKSVNLNHKRNAKDIYMTESFILNEHHKFNHDKFKDIELGTWMVSYKVDNDEVWESIKNGEFNGFSVEMAGELIESKLYKQLFKNIKFMGKSKVGLKLRNILKSFIKLGYVMTDKGRLDYDGDVLEQGMEVFIQDEDGVLILAPDGDYTQNGVTYHVVGGIVESISSEQDNKADTNQQADTGDINKATGETVPVEEFNKVVEALKTVGNELDIIEGKVEKIEEKVDFIEEFKKQQAELTQQNAELKKEVSDTKQKLESALKNTRQAIKPVPQNTGDKVSNLAKYNLP